MANKFKENTTKMLIIAAKSYHELINSMIVLKSEDFLAQKTYNLCFDKTNFLHLTGVLTDLSPLDFYEKCYKGIIKDEDYYYNDFNNKNMIKSKMINLVQINKFFKQEIMVQEEFRKNNIFCKIATADNECTIGFIGSFLKLYPKTLLKNNHLNRDKNVILVMPIIKKINK